MLQRILPAVLVLALTAVGYSAEGPAANESLEGPWLLTASTAFGGEKVPAEFIEKIKGKLIFAKDGTYEQYAGSVKMESGKYKVDAAKAPAWFDAEMVDGPSKGKSQVGIFKIEAGKLTLVLAKVGTEERPQGFEPSPKFEVSTFKRAD